MPRIAKLGLEPVPSETITPQDQATPSCYACGNPHVGIREVCYLVLRGAYYIHSNLGDPVFVLDPDSTVQVMVLPTGKQALLVRRRDDGKQEQHTFTVDEMCMEHALDHMDWSRDMEDEFDRG